MKRFIALLIIILFTNCTHNIPHSSIVSSKDFAEIAKQVAIDDKTLILIDIDNTIFSSSTAYGSAEFFTEMVKEEMEKTGCSSAQAKLKVYDRWIKSQQIVKTQIIDKGIYKFIEQARGNRALVLAFTARQPSIATVTENQLSKHHIELDNLVNLEFRHSYHNQIGSHREGEAIYHDSETLFYHGIVFCHDLNSKGKVFKDFYKELISWRKQQSLPIISKVIFIDDGIHNLESLKTALADLGIDFFGFHFQYSNKFNKEQALQEEKMLNRGH